METGRRLSETSCSFLEPLEPWGAQRAAAGYDRGVHSHLVDFP